MEMETFDITLTPSDVQRLGPEIIEGIKGFLTFEKARFLPCRTKEDILDILMAIPMSARQRERAEREILKKNGFWDRVGQRALIPIIPKYEDLYLGLLELIAVPKDVSPDEAKRILCLIKTILQDRLVLTKLSRTSSTGDEPPLYILDLLKNSRGQGLNIVQASFFHKTPGHERIQKAAEDVFPGAHIELAGRSCSTLWYTIQEVGENNFSKGIRKLALLLTKMGQPFRTIMGHRILKDLEEVSHLQHVAKGLKSAVLMPSAMETILLKTGADLMSPAFGTRQTLTGLGNRCCVMVSIESLAAGNRIKEGFLHMEAGPEILQVGPRCLMLYFRGITIHRDSNLAKWTETLFQEMVRIARSSITVGVACPCQSGVSKRYLPFSALMALLHAHLLGKGKLAVFDHVTCNVHGDLLVSWGDIKGACRAYRAGLKLNPSDANLLNSLGVCLADLKRTKDAQDCFHKVLVSTPDNFMALYNLSGINLNQGNLQEAERQAQKAYSMDKHNPVILIRLANCWMRQKKFGQVIQLLLPQIPENPAAPALSLLKICGQAALEMGDWEKAKEILAMCLKRKKNDPLCLALLAKGYFSHEHDYETALRLLTRISERALHIRAVKDIMEDLQQKIEMKKQL